MKILYVHQYFKTPEEGGANRSYYMAKAMVEAGHEVVMLTSHNEPKLSEKMVDGISVVYLPVNYSNFFDTKERILSFLKFVQQAKKWLRKNHAFDKCIATSTPLTVGSISLWLKKRFNIPYVFEVRDLWPEAPIQMGVFKNPLVKRGLRNYERKIYENADAIIALSPGMRKHIQKVVPDKTIALIPNVADCHFFKPSEKKSENLELHYGVKNKFVVSYFGAIGPVNDLMSLVRSAEFCLDLPLRFLIMGEGRNLSGIKQYVKERNISNVFFVPYGTKEDVRKLMDITDACYVSFLHKPVLRTNSPNKFFDAIASGKMIITNIQGWIRGLVEEKHFGIYADSDIPVELREKLLPFIESKELLLRYQKNAREAAENYFNREQLSAQFLATVEGSLAHKMINHHIFTLSA